MEQAGFKLRSCSDCRAAYDGCLASLKLFPHLIFQARSTTAQLHHS